MKEILFAQRLADNEKKVRDRALKKLRKYLGIKSSGGSAISGEDALKLWKGLFYCMYMADKPLVQEAVAEDISGLIHYINNEEDCQTFVRAGFLTFAREWNGIDVFRIDKYMMFVRRFLRHVFTHLRACDWHLKNVMAYTSILEATVVCPDDNVNNTPMGLKTHVCEVILEELAKVGGEKLQHSVVMAVIQPYFKVLALTKMKAYTKFVREGIIHHLIRQTLCAEEEEEEEGVDNTVLETEGTAEEDAESEEKMDEDMESALDPRAGRVDTYIPQLKVDLNLLADSLQKVGSVSRVHTRNREVIYKLVCELRDAAQGHDPLALPSDHVDDVEVPDTEVENAVARLEKFEDDLRAGRKPENEDIDDDDLKPVKKRQFKSKYQKKKYLRLKNKKQRPKGLPKAKRKKLDKRQQELAQKRALAVDHMVRRVTTAAGVPRSSIVKPSLEGQMNGNHGFQVSPISQKKISSTAPKAFANSFTVEVASEVHKKRKNVEKSNKVKKKKCFNVSVLDVQSNGSAETNAVKEKENVGTSVPSEGQTKEKPTTSVEVKKTDGPVQVSACNGKMSTVIMQKPSAKNEKLLNVHKNIETAKKQNMQPIDNKVQKSTNTKPTDNVVSENEGIVINFSESKKQKGLGSVTPQKKSPWDMPLKKGEYEVFIESRKQVKKTKEKKMSPIKRRLTASVPRQRTISINLKKNKEHEFSDYVRTLRASPCIPFKADQTPKAPVLKPSPSPILVKGPLLRKKIQKKVAASASPKLSLKKKRQTAADFF